jgi:hypothetical protein
MQTEYSLCQQRAHDIQTVLQFILNSKPRATAVPAVATIAKTFPAVFGHHNRIFKLDVAPLRVWQCCFDGEAHAVGHKVGDGFVGQAGKRLGTSFIDLATKRSGADGFAGDFRALGRSDLSLHWDRRGQHPNQSGTNYPERAKIDNWILSLTDIVATM